MRSLRGTRRRDLSVAGSRVGGKRLEELNAGSGCDLGNVPAECGGISMDHGEGGAAEYLPRDDSRVAPSAWYVQASAEFSTLITGRELARIGQYAADAECRANTLRDLFTQDPFPEEEFVAAATAIIEESEGIDDHIATLKNTVVRFVRAARPEYAGRMPVRSRGRRS